MLLNQQAFHSVALLVIENDIGHARLDMLPTTSTVASSPKLLDRVRWQLPVKHYSLRTEQAYVD